MTNDGDIYYLKMKNVFLFSKSVSVHLQICTITQRTTASFDFHQIAGHKRTTLFSFYALPSGGKSKAAVVRLEMYYLKQCLKCCIKFLL